MSDPAIAGIILAGGQSRRMGGGDKALRLLAGKPMLAHVIQRFQPQVSLLALNANGDPARFAAFGLPIIADSSNTYAGPLAGILAGLTWARSAVPSATHVASVSCDTPFLPTDFVSRIYEAGRGHDRIVVACANGQLHPTFGLWPISLGDDLQETLSWGLRKVQDWTAKHMAVHCDFTSDGLLDPFFNVNTPEDLDSAQKHFSDHHGTRSIIFYSGLVPG